VAKPILKGKKRVKKEEGKRGCRDGKQHECFLGGMSQKQIEPKASQKEDVQG